jgi:hypothetical protein
MARSIPYLFCRFGVSKDEQPLSALEFWATLEKIKGKPVGYRVREPNPDQLDTYLLMPRQKRLTGHQVFTWEVAKELRFRERSKYDKDNDHVTDEMIVADEISHTKFIAVPELGVFAVDDTVSDRTLGAKSAVNRFRTIVETLEEDAEVFVQFAGTPQDAQKAVETWTLDQFSFSVRPFNPHPRKLGEKIHELMVKDDVGSLRAVATPADGSKMHDSQ